MKTRVALAYPRGLERTSNTETPFRRPTMPIGRLTIHHGKQYQVMTNSPVFSEQLPLAAYWKAIGGSTMLPGTTRATDRFARLS